MIAFFGGPLDGKVKDHEVIGRSYIGTVTSEEIDQSVTSPKLSKRYFLTVEYAWERIWEHDGKRHATAVFIQVCKRERRAPNILEDIGD